MAEEKVTSWYWQGDNVINSISIGDVNADGQKEITSAGYYNNGTHNWATETIINSVSIGDINNDGVTEVVTCGSYFDGLLSNAQLTVWDVAQNPFAN